MAMAISRGVQWFARGTLAVLAIYLGSTYLIHYYVDRPVSKQPTLHTIKHTPIQDEQFQSLLQSGKQAFQNGVYTDALDKFSQAQRSVMELTDDQYDSLRASRLQVAQAYEAAQDSRSADGVYRALADCAIRQGEMLFEAKQYEDALRRAGDGEDFANHMSGGKAETLQGTVYLRANSLSALKRYPEAEQAIQRMIDYLKASADGYDRGFADNYLSLAHHCAEAKDWQGSEQALLLGIESSERTLEHYATVDNQTVSAQMVVSKNWAQYNLVIAKYQEGEIDAAFSSAQEFYDEYLRWAPDPRHPENVAYHASDFAALALQIAREQKRDDEIAIWQPRAPASIRVVAIRPVGTH